MTPSPELCCEVVTSLARPILLDGDGRFEAARPPARDSETLSRTLLASIPQRVFYKDTAGRFLLVNPAFAADFGQQPEAFVGKTDADFFPAELAAKFRADDLRVMESRQPETLVEANLLPGGWRFVEVIKSPVVSEDGELLGILGLFTDVTERVRVEEELDQERELLHCLMDHAPDLIYFKDRGSRFTRVNRACAEHMGLKEPAEVLGKTDFDFFSPVLATEFFQDEQEIIRTGLPLQNKVEYGRDGSRCILSTKVPILKDGQAVGIMGISRDVTERVRAEEELKRTAQELARSNEELQQFAYVASHDLQEPLRMVASYTQLLERRYRDRLDADANEFIRYAVDGALRMQGLINDLLEYSRVGTRGAGFEPVDLHAPLERALANLRVALQESGAVVTHDPLPTLLADESQMAQLLQNLIGNGVKFRRDSAPRIHLSAEEREDEWRFAVRDDGIGIEPECAERIFAIFQRLHTRERYAGSGIGLSICRKIVTRHGGRIWADTASGPGATFHFTLPTSPGSGSVPGDPS